mmetsp:Transcript_40944/g.79726  ORF Transcript_40944/g.79726 Transcript_40944/m.79726 type:complete len:332 (-) Transcript_40944:155-1150(-)
MGGGYSQEDMDNAVRRATQAGRREAEKARKEFQQQIKAIREQMNKPIAERKRKAVWVNERKLSLRINNSVFLLGPKGSGKSTFLSLMETGLGVPSDSISDGTKTFIDTKRNDGKEFTDSVGTEICPSQLLKLFAIFIVKGFPSDLIVFGNSRRVEPIFQNIEKFGFGRVMFTCFKSFDHVYPRGNDSDEGDSTEDSDMDVAKQIMSRDKEGMMVFAKKKYHRLVYDTKVHRIVDKERLGFSVTHDTVNETMKKRAENSSPRPFEAVITAFGGKGNLYKVPTSQPKDGDPNQHLIEVVFHFVRLYLVKYYKKEDGDVTFMNSATLHEAKALE